MWPQRRRSVYEQSTCSISWLLANLTTVSALLDDEDDADGDDDDDDESGFGAREADGSLHPPSCVPLHWPPRPFESMIPVNTLITAWPDCTGPRPLTVQVSVEAVEWTWLTLAAKPCRRAAFQQRKTKRQRGREMRLKRERPPRILWLIKSYYPAQQEVPEK